MALYILKRLLLIIPTLFGVMVVSFIIVQFAPGGPVERMISVITGQEQAATAKISGTSTENIKSTKTITSAENNTQSKYRGAQGLDPTLIKEIEKLYGFDKPPLTRFIDMIKNYLTFNFGDSFYRNEKVVNIVIEKMPVSISLGLWTTLLVYLISIPLGIAKAVQDGSRLDLWTSTIMVIGYAIPNFLFGLLLILLFSGGSFLQIFPLKGLTSENWHDLSWFGKIKDYLWHIVLPVTAMVVGGFASLTMLTKNSFIEEIKKHYVQTARAKGLSENQVLYKHVFRNAMLIVVAGFPDALLKIFFTGAFLIEIIFSLDGLGLLSYEAVINRDYPLVFGTLFFFTLLGLLFNLIGDLVLKLIDPRIDFENREV